MQDFVHFSSLKEYSVKPFEVLDDQWMLLTAAKKDGTINTMTASWGGFGIMWDRCVTSITLRPQRFTKEFIDESLHYSLSFFPKEYRKDLAYLGDVSGRDEDKITQTNLTSALHEGIPYFKEASQVIFCRVLVEQTIPESCFHDKSLLPEFYPDKDFHHLYFGEITSIYEKEAVSS